MRGRARVLRGGAVERARRVRGQSFSMQASWGGRVCSEPERDRAGTGAALTNGQRAGFSRWAGYSQSDGRLYLVRTFLKNSGRAVRRFGANCKIKSLIPAEIQGIGARKFVEM
jgi:hypothetical protein